MSRRHHILLALSAVALGTAACREATVPDAPSAGRETLTVYTVNYPLQYFAERIGRDLVEVVFPAPGDVDPAEWRPDDETIRRYQQADLILLNGAGYARWTRHVSLPAGRQVDTAAGFPDQLLEVPDAVVHSHGDGDPHAHAGTAFTTWIDPLLALEHARAIKEAFRDRLPEHTAVFEQSFEALAGDLRALHGELEAAVARDPDRPLFASHPVYHYLEARYGLKLESFHWEPDEMPGESAWEAFERKRAEFPASWMLWEDQPLDETAALLAGRGVESIVFNPCSQPPATGDFLDVMRENASNLHRAFAPDDNAAAP